MYCYSGNICGFYKHYKLFCKRIPRCSSHLCMFTRTASYAKTIHYCIIMVIDVHGSTVQVLSKNSCLKKHSTFPTHNGRLLSTFNLWVTTRLKSNLLNWCVQWRMVCMRRWTHSRGGLLTNMKPQMIVFWRWNGKAPTFRSCPTWLLQLLLLITQRRYNDFK